MTRTVLVSCRIAQFLFFLPQKLIHEPVSSKRPTRVALVFGREELGMSDEEVDECDLACCIPIGRLQESLSLSHAVSIALSGIYSQRLASVAAAGDPAGYAVSSLAGLATGYDASVGTEH